MLKKITKLICQTKKPFYICTNELLKILKLKKKTKMARQTSIDCYNQIKAQGLLSKMRFKVYECILTNVYCLIAYRAGLRYLRKLSFTEGLLAHIIIF